jgi:hypothetical protein
MAALFLIELLQVDKLGYLGARECVLSFFLTWLCSSLKMGSLSKMGSKSKKLRC